MNTKQKTDRKSKKDKCRPKEGKPHQNPLLLPILCAGGSLLIYLLLFLTGRGRGGLQTITELEREAYGGNEITVELMVEGAGMDNRSVPVTVKAREYTAAEAGRVFETVMEEMGMWILGDNVSLMEVRSDLNLITYLEPEGVRLQWMSDLPDLLDTRGQVNGTDVGEQGEAGYLSVRLSAGQYKTDYEIPVRIYPPVFASEEREIRDFIRQLTNLDEEQRHQKQLQLPGEYQGNPMRYYREQSDDYRMIPLLGCLLAVLLVVRDKEQEQKRRKQREEQLLLDYSEVVSKFMVFLGAGLTIRLSLERIVDDYRKALENGRQKPRHAYEELCQTCYQIQSGVSEGKAYRELGERCRLQPYLKLGSLLEQNRKSGTKDLRVRMKAEMEDAFEQRKNLVKRLGEEASTKLALPLFMMLGVVMVIVLFPALMNMT